MNTFVLLQGQVGHSRGDSERRGGRRRGKSRRGEWADAFLQYVRGGMLSWCWQTCWCWNADAQPHLSGDGGRVGSDPAAGEVPKGLRARQQTFHLTAVTIICGFEHPSPSPTSSNFKIPHLLRCFGVSLPPNGANSDSGEPTCLADIWRLPTVIYPFLYG